MTTRMSWCPEVGATLSDRYELERRLGEGPTGVVFVAKDRKLSEPCALKVLHPALFDGAHNATNLLRLQRARAFVHAGIAKLRDVVMDDDRVFLVTELLGGVPLDAWIARQGAPSSPDVNTILGQLVAALEWIHQIGVHGNLKPANVFVEAGPKVTMTDPWTLAGRAQVPRAALPAVDEAWLAPEQRRPGWEESRAADVHGLGLLLGLMTAGRRVTGGLPLIAQGVVAPIALDTVFERATATAPGDRFASVRALFEAAEPAVMAASLPLGAPGRAGGAARSPDETSDDALADAGMAPEHVDALLGHGEPPSSPPTAPPDGGPAEATRGETSPAGRSDELGFSEPSDISFGFGAPDETIVDFSGGHGAPHVSPIATTLPPLEAAGGDDGMAGPAEATLVLRAGARAAATGDPASGAGADTPTRGAFEGEPIEESTAAPLASGDVSEELDLTTRLDAASAAAVLEASGAEAASEPTLMDAAATFEMPASVPPPGWAPDAGGAAEAAPPSGGEGAVEDGPETAGRDPLAVAGASAEAQEQGGARTEVLEADILVEADVLEADILVEADVLEADVLEADILVEADVPEADALGADVPEVTGAEEGAAGPSDGAETPLAASELDLGGGTEPDASAQVGAEDIIELGASALIPEGAADALAARAHRMPPASEGGEAVDAEPLEVGDDSIVEAFEVDEDSTVELGASALLEVGADEAAVELGASVLIESPAEERAQVHVPGPPPHGQPGPRFKPGPGVAANRTGQVSVAPLRAGEGLPGLGGGADALALGFEDGLPAPDSELLGGRADSVLSVAPLGSALDAYDSMDASVPARPRGSSERRLGATIPPGTASALGAATSGVSSARAAGGPPRRTTTRSHELRKPVMLKRRRSPLVYVAVGLMLLAATVLVFVLTRADEPPPDGRQVLATGASRAGVSTADARAASVQDAGTGAGRGAPGADAGGEGSSRVAADAGAPPSGDAGPSRMVTAGAVVDAGAGAATLDRSTIGLGDARVSAAADATEGDAPSSAPEGAVADAGTAVSAAQDAAARGLDTRDAGPSVAAPDVGGAPKGPTAATFVPKDPKRFRCPGGMAKVRSRRKVTLADGTKVKDWDIFCIDKYEYPGQGRPPRVNIGLSEAKAACKARGRRLCSRSEWRKGCGGKYPYGRTYDPTRCNTVGEGGMPRPLVTAGFKRTCRSGWGTYDMVGNAAEWTSDGRVNGGSAYKDGASATCFRSSRRMGGHPYVGFRCCADAIPK